MPNLFVEFSDNEKHMGDITKGFGASSALLLLPNVTMVSPNSRACVLYLKMPQMTSIVSFSGKF